MLGLYIALGILGFVLLFVILAVITMYRLIFFSPRKGQINDSTLVDSKNFKNYQEDMKENILSFMKREYEDVYITSFDGLKLHARLFDNKESKKIAILLHGYKGTVYRDFNAISKILFEEGYKVLAVDERAHGTSEGHVITFGARESKDLLSWLDYVKERFNDNEILLVGVSMGGHTVLNISDKIDKDIKIIADCPYSSPKEILVSTIKSVHLPVFIFYPLLNLTCHIFARESLNKTSAYNSIKNSDNKILIMHGDKDKVIPYTISKKLADTYHDKIRYEVFKNADHGGSALVDYNRYQKVVKEFLKD